MYLDSQLFCTLNIVLCRAVYYCVPISEAEGPLSEYIILYVLGVELPGHDWSDVFWCVCVCVCVGGGGGGGGGGGVRTSQMQDK